MKPLLFFLLFVCSCKGVVSQQALPGIACYEDYAPLLAGKRIGLVTNHTSLVDGRHSVDFLQAKGVELVKIFAPEHGFRGNAEAGEVFGDYRDSRSGLPVISLYGKKKKPTPGDLVGIDLLLFDMQDMGVRFYTYLSTLHYIMEACAENGLPLIVADRPNPNAFYVDGPVLQQAFSSFLGMHPVPVVYGMTIGEYARMINGEGWLAKGMSCGLEVIRCRNWSREQSFPLDVPPSPNLPDSVSVRLYPSVCFFEGTVVNEGRGTLIPFQVFGHPELLDMPFSYIPRAIEGMSTSPKCRDRMCYGMDLRDRYDAVYQGKRLDFSWLLSAYRNYRGKAPFFNSHFDLLAGNDTLRKAILAGKSETELREMWQEELAAFMQVRMRYLLYEE